MEHFQHLQITGEGGALLVDIARAQRDKKIPRPKQLSGHFSRFRPHLLVDGMGRSGRQGGIRNHLPSHPGDGLLAGRINSGHDRGIGQRERPAEIRAKGLRPRVAMRLEEQQHAPPSGITGGPHHGGDFGRMVPVIIDEQMLRRGMEHLEPPAGPAECFERGGAFGQIKPKLGGQREHRGGIEGIVLTRDIERDPRHLGAVVAKDKSRGEVGRAKIPA